MKRVKLDAALLDMDSDARVEQLLAIDEALGKLAAEEPDKATLVKLRFFCGLSIEEAAEAMNVSRATACRYWTYAKTWLFCELKERESTEN